MVSIIRRWIGESNMTSPYSDGTGYFLTKTVTFDGGTLNGIGDIDGTQNPYTLFTVSGLNKSFIWGSCTSDLTDVGNGGKISVGVTGNLVGLMSLVTATTIDTNEIYSNTGAIGITIISTALKLVNNLNILLNCSIENITGGTIIFYCYYTPLSLNAVIM